MMAHDFTPLQVWQLSQIHHDVVECGWWMECSKPFLFKIKTKQNSEFVIHQIEMKMIRNE